MAFILDKERGERHGPSIAPSLGLGIRSGQKAAEK